MLLFFVLFMEAFRLLDQFLGAVFLSSSELISLMVLILFGFGALAIFAHQRWAWAAAIISLLVIVGLETMSPHKSMLVILGSIAVAGAITAIIKRYIMDFLRRDARRSVSVGGPRVPRWLRLVLTLI